MQEISNCDGNNVHKVAPAYLPGKWCEVTSTLFRKGRDDYGRARNDLEMELRVGRV